MPRAKKLTEVGGFKVGDLVRLNRKVRVREGATGKTARISYFRNDDVGGVVLDRTIVGFAWWNVADLIHAKRETKA
jgi:hypothetical protein